MSSDRHLEHLLRGWLDEEGPQDVPERVIDLALIEAATTARERPLPGFARWIDDRVRDVAVAREMSVARTWGLVVMPLLLVGLVAIAAGAFLLTLDGGSRSHPIAFAYEGDVWVLGSDPEAEPQRETNTPDALEAGPVWSPDGTRLAYWVSTLDSRQIHVREWPNGGTEIVPEVPDMSLRSDVDSIAWSPDSTRIVATWHVSRASNQGGPKSIKTAIIHDLANDSTTVIARQGLASVFGWSPDGATIGLVASDGIALYDVESETSTLIDSDLLGGETTSVDPVFSADGNSIVFTHADSWSDDGDIRSIGLDGTPADLALAGPTNDLRPAIAASGDHLAFVRSPADSLGSAIAEFGNAPNIGSEIVVIPAAGGDEIKVAESVLPSVTWSPDGKQVVAWSVDGAELIVVDIDRPEQQHRYRMAAGSDEPIDQ
jgi:Tol biopolymer transport system component